MSDGPERGSRTLVDQAAVAAVEVAVRRPQGGVGARIAALGVRVLGRVELAVAADPPRPLARREPVREHRAGALAGARDDRGLLGAARVVGEARARAAGVRAVVVGRRRAHVAVRPPLRDVPVLVVVELGVLAVLPPLVDGQQPVVRVVPEPSDAVAAGPDVDHLGHVAVGVVVVRVAARRRVADLLRHALRQGCVGRHDPAHLAARVGLAAGAPDPLVAALVVLVGDHLAADALLRPRSHEDGLGRALDPAGVEVLVRRPRRLRPALLLLLRRERPLVGRVDRLGPAARVEDEVLPEPPLVLGAGLPVVVEVGVTPGEVDRRQHVVGRVLAQARVLRRQPQVLVLPVVGVVRIAEDRRVVRLAREPCLGVDAGGLDRAAQVAAAVVFPRTGKRTLGHRPHQVAALVRPPRDLAAVVLARRRARSGLVEEDEVAVAVVVAQRLLAAWVDRPGETVARGRTRGE